MKGFAHAIELGGGRSQVRSSSGLLVVWVGDGKRWAIGNSIVCGRHLLSAKLSCFSCPHDISRLHLTTTEKRIEKMVCFSFALIYTQISALNHLPTPDLPHAKPSRSSRECQSQNKALAKDRVVL